MSRASRFALGVLAVASVAFLPAKAAGDPLSIDIDRDGVRDRVSIQRGPSGLLIWLSATQSFQQLRTSRLLTAVTLADIDRDGRLEVYAADALAGVRVWRQGATGKFHRVRMRHQRPVAERVPRRFGAGTDNPSDALTFGQSGPSAADATGLVRARSPGRGAVHWTTDPARSCSPHATSRLLRGPPTR